MIATEHLQTTRLIIASALYGPTARSSQKLILSQKNVTAKFPTANGRISAGCPLVGHRRVGCVRQSLLARSLGALDVGQTVVVKRGVVLAVEALEGTDACIARGGALADGAVVVKAFKPQQDPRFDVPAVGPETVAAMRAARCAALAIEAGKALVLDREALASAADDAGIAVEGV